MEIDENKARTYDRRYLRAFGVLGVLGAILGANVDGPPHEQPECRFGVMSKRMGPHELLAFDLLLRIPADGPALMFRRRRKCWRQSGRIFS